MTTQTPNAARSTSTEATSSDGVHDRGLLAIAIFKLLKSVFFFAVGLGAMHLLHKDLGDEVMRIALALNRDPEGKIVSFVLEKIDLVDAHKLKQIGAASFAYSGLVLTEGYGLWREKPWAEYLTVTLTVALLPWEIYEIVERPSWLRAGVFLTNVLVFAYLLWILRAKRLRK